MNHLTDQQFEALSENLQIWAVRKNTVIYAEYGSLISNKSLMVFIEINPTFNYPTVIEKHELLAYDNVWVDLRDSL